MAGLGIENPIIIGNSIGGAAAILYASRHPVRGLVLCDSGGLVPVDALARAYCGLFERLFAAGARGARWFPAIYDLYYRLVLTEPAARRRREEIIAAGRELAPLLRQAWASFARPEADLRDTAAAIEAPIWIAWARADRIIPLSLVRPAVRRMKRARLSLFGGGHTPFLEQPSAFAAQFLNLARTW
jgi:4,5:9,10-diseco-3-hydroxy-5,9,17-trioxoandrosta-1(10),2-diene-4-oate hydrolase